jgi:monoterpene epsilon-lactone hydrolase
MFVNDKAFSHSTDFNIRLPRDKKPRNFMPSLRAKILNRLVRLLVKRRRWGRDERAVARRARRLFGTPRVLQWIYAVGLRVELINEKDVRGEWLQTKRAKQETILYIHGGGFVSCTAAAHRPATAALARLTNFRVFALDYRLAPEHRFPAAADDALAAYKWLLAQNIPAPEISLAGNSAGGNLVLNLLVRLRDENLPLPACAACFSPWTDLAGTGESIKANAEACHMFYPENIEQFARVYLGDAPALEKSASPVFADFNDLPPVLFQVGSTEILLDDARRIHQKILQAGGASELEIYDDVFHSWQLAGDFLPEAPAALQKAAAFIRRNS